MKSIIRTLLRKMGLLNWVRKMAFKYQYGQLFSLSKGTYKVNYRGTTTLFSVEDPYSSNFFATYFKTDVYEKEGVDVLFREVKQKDVVFDVGANIGYFTCLIANHYDDVQVHAFEMGHENFKILLRNVELNKLKNAVANLCAVSDSTGNVKVVDSVVGNAVLKIVDSAVVDDDLIQVNSISLDDYCKQRSITPDIIKIDVEGAEMKVLQGMKSLLSGKARLLIEIHEADLKYFNSSKEEVIRYIQSFGYTLNVIGNDVKKNILVFAFK